MIQYRDTLEAIIPARRLFFQEKKANIKTGIRTLFLLILEYQSSELNSLADSIDHICER